MSKVHFKVKKRDGRVVKYDRSRIATGIFKAAENVGVMIEEGLRR
jgi:transcriptional regulator NrdR family protein